MKNVSFRLFSNVDMTSSRMHVLIVLGSSLDLHVMLCFFRSLMKTENKTRSDE